MDWQTFLSVFGFVFIAELGDKTQLAVIAQTCKHRRLWPVFMGASGALILVTGLSALGGRVLGRVVPRGLFTLVAALAFVVMGLLVTRRAWMLESGALQSQGCECVGEAGSECPASSAWDWSVFGRTFGLLFLAELGDKTQLAVMSLSGGRGSPWAVFGGGTLALVVITALGTLGGSMLCRLISRRVLLWVSGIAFIAMGVLLGAGVL